MGTDAAVSNREPLFTKVYRADGKETTNGTIRVRRELLDALYERNLLDSIKGSFTLLSGNLEGVTLHYRIEVHATGKIYHAEAPACLGEVTMCVYEV